METTNKLNMKISTEATIDTDKIKETILGYGENFKVLDFAIAGSISGTEVLKVGTEYPYGQRIWNSLPSIGTYIGWVNTRKGVHAPEWKDLKEYATNDIIRAKPDNGNIYKCISPGRAMRKTPVFSTSADAEFYDAVGTNWEAEYNHDATDVVFPSDGNKVFYYICETAGLTAEIEPDWDLVATGTTVLDGSVVWRKQKAIKWKQVNNSCDFRPFGKID